MQNFHATFVDDVIIIVVVLVIDVVVTVDAMRQMVSTLSVFQGQKFLQETIQSTSAV